MCIRDRPDVARHRLELDLAAAYGSVKELREGYEILPLYPSTR